MCGIVGHIGSLNSLNIVLDGLESLEYRGYDSAGVSVIGSDNKVMTFKKEGRLENLRAIVPNGKDSFTCGIGHTRWATHGEVNKTNSHPHNGKGFSVVHNGIIENANELRDSLAGSGIKFLSETDSEVFVRLIEEEMKKTDFRTAVLHSFSKVDGNNCFVILNESEKKIYAIKNNAPLACGVNEQEDNFFISSDPYSLQKYIKTVFFPDNGTLVEVGSESGIEFSDSNSAKNKGFKSETHQMLNQDNSKGGFEHFMLKEIHEQANLISASLSKQINSKSWTKIKKIPNRIMIVACGTAYYAGLYIKSVIEEDCRIPVSVDMASEFRYSNPVMDGNSLAVFISQSGETADTLAALEMCKSNGLQTLSILNVPHSTIFRQSDVNLMINAGPEIGVASTKAFSLQCLTGALFAKYLKSIISGDDNFSFDQFNSDISALSSKVQEVVSRSDEIKKIAEEVHHLKSFFFTGRYKNFPIALEGALKLKEIAYVHAEGYASGELKHGPIAMIDEEVINIAYIDENLFEKTLSNIQEIKTRKGIILGVGDTKGNELSKIAKFSFHLETKELGQLAPIALNVFGQLFSYYVAKHKGTDIDKPRNLAKSVTVE